MRTESSHTGTAGRKLHQYLHLVAARKANAPRFYTLNLSHFLALRRHGDPEIAEP